jgi:hypothetical protein
METNWKKQQIFDFALICSKELNYTVNGDLMKIFKDLGGHLKIVSLDGKGSVDYFVCHRRCKFETVSVLYTSKFEIAKAIGHYFLHSRIGNPLVIPMGHTGRMEVEGNWFATRFLLPEPEFTERLNEWKSTARLSVHFGVPECAISLLDLPEESVII